MRQNENQIYPFNWWSIDCYLIRQLITSYVIIYLKEKLQPSGLLYGGWGKGFFLL